MENNKFDTFKQKVISTFNKLKEKVVNIYNNNKGKKWFMPTVIGGGAIVVVFLLSAIILIGSSCGTGLRGDSKKIYNFTTAVFNTLDEPEEANLISGCIDEFGDAYLFIEHSSGQEVFFVDGRSKKVYDTRSVINYFGSHSHEYLSLKRLAFYEDSSIDYDKINNALDKKFK